ncbi:hypothetical protein BJ138DRAFT_1166483 [Hygrophoropsis aurantiaca]|uniref:Uncharacterized protein n=1 Tax=Hygrophoropsis aurantiaca TaxID=72124 RepID=A0ACB7ZTG4_9AGAM|nr:hypothetical protein BJ138DRAFT_1166483 [Hygrophoropsis aurantiaca]
MVMSNPDLTHPYPRPDGTDNPTHEPSEEELCALYAAFAAMPDNLSPPDFLGDPPNLKAAMASPQSSEWTTPLQEEFDSLKKHKVYTLIPRSEVPAGRKIMHGKPLFKLKRDFLGNLARYKARHVRKGYEAISIWEGL